MTQIRLSLPQAALDNVIVLNVHQSRGRNVSVVTASQLVRVPLVSLDRVDVHGLALPHIEAVVTDLPAALGVEGLLGMSFLKQCRLVLDGLSHFLELSTEAG
jgi:predicted aspartyl protease